MAADRVDLSEIQERVQAIQRRKRSRVRWQMSQHTAEMVIGALRQPSRELYRGSAKRRRRKRYKRLL